MLPRLVSCSMIIQLLWEFLLVTMLPLATLQKFHSTFNAISIHMLETENLLLYPSFGKLFPVLALGSDGKFWSVPNGTSCLLQAAYISKDHEPHCVSHYDPRRCVSLKVSQWKFMSFRLLIIWLKIDAKKDPGYSQAFPHPALASSTCELGTAHFEIII